GFRSYRYPDGMRVLKTVRITLAEDLVEAVDRAARKLGKTRSALARDALREVLAREPLRTAERRHRRGYSRQPVRRGEFFGASRRRPVLVSHRGHRADAFGDRERLSRGAPLIFVDSNVPMYIVGAPHPHKADAQRLLERCISDNERLVTDAEVLQEILHRYV